ncbi:DUF3810 domain-containing protein [Bacteroides sp.]|uniref:DUF3810 domain-containing protein n=1 Tax=Bacteroides sp. TaxID=29523 RepID=UPI002607E190|nr:DUF3810 domain-containing protein [Bacteroides sp.]MDD3036772.1 DUF3810 domain-containing protein [Bacteroides sp.]
MMKQKLKIRYIILGVLLLLVWMTQWIPALATIYSQKVYPVISSVLSAFSNLFPLAIGDLFIFLSIAGVIVYPIYARLRKKLSWKKILLRDGEYLLWIYVWFYLVWGLNYSQKNFYQRSGIPYTAYTPENFQTFVDDYITQLNRSYTLLNNINRNLTREESVRLYNQLSDSLAVHRPPHANPKVKTMLFTPLISMVGVTGSMGPFFCEFTLNGDLLPVNYPATYAHELAHLLGITNEAEANFYAYQVCTRSKVMGIRFSGYFSVLSHVLGNARGLLSEEEYTNLFKRIRPEIIEIAKQNQAYWSAKYSPIIGDVQDWIYDLYLKGNKIGSGRKNYSEVIGLLISYQESLKRK